MTNIQHKAKNITKPVYSSFIPNMLLTIGDSDDDGDADADEVDDDISDFVTEVAVLLCGIMENDNDENNDNSTE